MAVSVEGTVDPQALAACDTVVAFVVEGEQPHPLLPAAALAAIERGEARSKPKAVAHFHHENRRYILVGAGRAEHGERLRQAAAVAQGRAVELASRRVALLVGQRQGGVGAAEAVGPLLEGFLLASYRFQRFKRAEEPQVEEIVVGAIDAGLVPDQLQRLVARATTLANAANSCRELQNRPANDLTPQALGEEAKQLARQLDRIEVEVEGREGIVARGMGAFAAVAQGSATEPALITLRYRPVEPVAGAPVLGLVGKAVTFDSGGISLKSSAKMAEMKFDMSGGAAVLCAVGAIAALGLPLEVVAVIGATENLPGGSAVKPGDIVRAASGKTIEINNTDAEGRLVLADCLHHATTNGATTLIDLATLTGAVVVALGSTYAGLIANDDNLAQRLIEAGARSGELLWRLPLHEEYDELVKGRYAELDNAPEGRKAGTIVGGTFLSNFTSGLPWAHLDIAGVAWDLGRPYAAKGGSGFGVRLAVELAESYCHKPEDR